MVGKRMMEVTFSNSFKAKFPNFPKADKEKIMAFVTHLKNFGFDGLEGHNKSSDNVPKNDLQWSIKVAYAQKYNLWHYLRAEKAKQRFARSQDKGYACSGYSKI